MLPRESTVSTSRRLSWRSRAILGTFVVATMLYVTLSVLGTSQDQTRGAWHPPRRISDGESPRDAASRNHQVRESEPSGAEVIPGVSGPEYRAKQMSDEDKEAGFVSVDVAGLPPKANLPQEASKDYLMMNALYHGKRARLRQYQEEHELGPLKMHTFYTVDCTQHSFWQVLTLERSWFDVNQGGFLSRVISGCKAGSPKAAMWLKSIVPTQVEATRFGSYFTPDSSYLPDGKYYAPANRPTSIWYWLNHTDLTEQIFVLIDPDMYFMHRLSVASVERGKPAAQYYGYMEGTAFERYRCPLCPDAQRAYHGSGMNSKKHYSVGPPWMLHVEDFKVMMPTWVRLLPMLRAIDDIWIIEMVAYAVAAAYHGLPHHLIHYGMVDHVRQHPLWDSTTDTLVAPNKDTDFQPIALLHYCYTWEVGEIPPKNPDEGAKQHERMVDREKQTERPVINYYHWSKYRTPSDWPGGKGQYIHNVLDCNAPLLQEIHTTNALPLITDPTTTANWRRTMFFLRTYLPALNRALTLWKRTVLNCTVPSEEQEAILEAAYEKHRLRQGPDPSSVGAPETLKQFINLAEQLRTSHPTYWISNYVIRSVNENLNDVTFETAKDARRRIYKGLREGTL